MIYSRFGSTVTLTRAITIPVEVEQLDSRPADAHDLQRLSFGMYAAGYLNEDADKTERLFDLALLRADDGIREINQAARAVGCNPK